MERKLLTFCCIIMLVVICGAFFLNLYYDPTRFKDLAMTKIQPAKVVISVENGFRYTREINLIAGAFVFLLLGCMFWVFYRKIKKDNQADLISKKEMEPTSLRDWAIALLVISVGSILPVLIAVFFGFSDFW